MKLKVRKAHNLLWARRRAYGIGWDQRPSMVHCLYVAIVRPTITFASLVMVAWMSNGQYYD